MLSLDIFIGADTANGEVVWLALAKFGATVADIAPNELTEPYTYFTWGNPPFRVDILTHISGVSFDDGSTVGAARAYPPYGATGALRSFVRALGITSPSAAINRAIR